MYVSEWFVYLLFPAFDSLFLRVFSFLAFSLSSHHLFISHPHSHNTTMSHLTHGQEIEYKEAFALFDPTNSGTIQPKAFADFLAVSTPHPVTLLLPSHSSLFLIDPPSVHPISVLIRLVSLS